VWWTGAIVPAAWSTTAVVTASSSGQLGLPHTSYSYRERVTRLGELRPAPPLRATTLPPTCGPGQFRGWSGAVGTAPASPSSSVSVLDGRMPRLLGAGYWEFACCGPSTAAPGSREGTGLRSGGVASSAGFAFCQRGRSARNARTRRRSRRARLPGPNGRSRGSGGLRRAASARARCPARAAEKPRRARPSK